MSAFKAKKPRPVRVDQAVLVRAIHELRSIIVVFEQRLKAAEDRLEHLLTPQEVTDAVLEVTHNTIDIPHIHV